MDNVLQNYINIFGGDIFLFVISLHICFYIFISIIDYIIIK